ncbi:hypothetical protein ACFOD1_03445 [Pseudidiomarina halophila]|uniref:DUF2513 domain-containing protein n=1 Tax=Pseudidiomarina halophila TaxID=1449799 RepID=A0A432XZ41_9GAMM|nr:hypothetical protein [Pseudidiomarina halophila]RUO54002.1 hypothetical protein CWI69_00785 [Pseudidiomarina halophila]
MIDTAYLQELLTIAKQKGYEGLPAKDIWDNCCSSEDSNSQEVMKFIYHMDAIWDSGLINWKDNLQIERWGFTDHGHGELTLTASNLVLTSTGHALAEKLSTDSKLKRFTQLVKSAGVTAGTIAFGELISAYISGRLS